MTTHTMILDTIAKQRQYVRKNTESSGAGHFTFMKTEYRVAYNGMGEFEIREFDKELEGYTFLATRRAKNPREALIKFLVDTFWI